MIRADQFRRIAFRLGADQRTPVPAGIIMRKYLTPISLDDYDRIVVRSIDKVVAGIRDFRSAPRI